MRVAFFLNDEFFADGMAVKNELMSRTFNNINEVTQLIHTNVDSDFNPAGSFELHKDSMVILDKLNNEEINLFNIHIGSVYIESETTLKPSEYWYGVSVVTDLLREENDTKYLPTDEMFGLAQTKYDEFLNSSFNVSEKSETDCILEFLKH